ncbi:WD40 repeat domain-containing protein [Flavobacterium bomense]|uniref:WD40 repeat domain-containing protein n=1 Tax=Flavobacterium bomense TaxID=2497483 RepID=A0A432CMR3_9FLAO|nr:MULTISPECIES: WD40 repeat domain-containing protein [Flavobacterium]RTY73435.1 WD40 repeat domain-containing protein [Flavobacterium sp. LS1R10]RTZ04861.1 WD40 repeat domain-containing protein [Flavobacterium bomense]
MITALTKIQIEKTGQFNGHGGAIYTLEFAHEAHLFYSGSSDNLVVEWNMKDQEQNKVVAKLPAKAMALKYVPDRNILLIGQSLGGIHVIDLKENKEIKLLQLHKEYIFDIQYLPETECFWVLAGDGTLSVWSINDFSLITALKLCDKNIRSIDFNIILKEAAIGCGDGSIRIFDFETYEEKKILKGHLDDFSVNTVRYHPNGKYLLSGSRDAYLNVWDIENNYALIHHIPAHNYAIYSIVFSPDKKFFATGSRDKTIKIWDAENFELPYRIDKSQHGGHTHSVNKLLWSDFNNYLISTGDDKTIMLWGIIIPM